MAAILQASAFAPLGKLTAEADCCPAIRQPPREVLYALDTMRRLVYSSSSSTLLTKAHAAEGWHNSSLMVGNVSYTLHVSLLSPVLFSM